RTDCHGGDGGQDEDFYPGEFSETWLYAPSRTADGALAALRAGSFFGVHGHIVRQTQLRVFAEGLRRPALAGEAIRVPPGAMLAVTLTFDLPLQDWRGKPNQVDEVELISDTPQETKAIY